MIEIDGIGNCKIIFILLIKMITLYIGFFIIKIEESNSQLFFYITILDNQFEFEKKICVLLFFENLFWYI